MNTMSAERPTENGAGQIEKPDHQPPLDEIFGVLQNQRRRRILSYLETEDTPTTIGTLAEHVAAAENDIQPSQLRSKQRKRVYISLYQSHLPKLASVDAVDYDKDRGTVEEGADFEAFTEVLRRQDSVDSESSDLRTNFSLAGSVLLATVLAVGTMTNLVGTTTFRLLAGGAIVVVAVLLAVGFVALPAN